MSAVDKQLKELAIKDQSMGIKTKFQLNENRCEQFCFEECGIYFDFCKTHIDENLLEKYTELADDVGFYAHRLELFSGAKINTSENRAVLHTLLRSPKNHGIDMVEPEIIQEANAAQENLEQSYKRIITNLEKRDTPVRSIIHVGIGGSALGPKLIYQALKGLDEHIDIHFVGNIDGHELAAVLAECEVSSTVVIGVSKTFTTAETLQNIRSIGVWFKEQGVEEYVENVIAVTASPANAEAFGIKLGNVVIFPDWVGGRYSVWSSVSLSVAIVLGYEEFQEFLKGAAAMDEHFVTTPVRYNLSFIAAALDHYYVNYFQAQSRAVFAYDYRLRSIVDYLQQLETESNGKDKTRNGEKVSCKTSPIVWGGVGTDVQHSVFQLLHQGTHVIPAEFILIKNENHELTEHHQELLANGIAQTAALLQGQTKEDIAKLHAKDKLTEIETGAKIFSGERPSVTIVLDELTPRSLGALLAFYEQRTFSYGALCEINSFDQMGVELGKRLAKEIKSALKPGKKEESKNKNNDQTRDVDSTVNVDASTQALIARIKNKT